MWQVLHLPEMSSMGLNVLARCEVIQPILHGSAHRKETLITGQKAHLPFQYSYTYLISVPGTGDGESQHMGTSDGSCGDLLIHITWARAAVPGAVAGLVASSHRVPDLSFILGLWEESKSTQQELDHLWQLQLVLNFLPYKGPKFSRGHEDGHNSSQTVALPPVLTWHLADVSRFADGRAFC